VHRSGWIALSALAVSVVLTSGWADAARADSAAPLFDPTSVAQIDFTLSQASKDSLNTSPATYVPATFSLSQNGTAYASSTVGLRLRGSTSFRTLDGKASFKVKFKEFGGPAFLGLKKLTLNNMVQDESMIHEELAYELFRGLGVPAPRTGYAYVRLNGDDYGVYLNVETLDNVSLPAWFASTGHLYEGAFDVDVRAGDVNSYEIDEGTSDRSDLGQLAADVAATAPGFSDRLAAHADLDEMARMWSAERYIGHWDGYSAGLAGHPPNNYYLHSDRSGRFSMLPWGTDQTFGELLSFDAPGALLFDGCIGDPACLAAFRSDLAAIPGTVAALGLDARAAQLASVLAPWQAADPRREYSLEQIAAGVAATREYLAGRPATLTHAGYWQQGPPLDPPTRPDDVPAADLTPPETTLDRTPPEHAEIRGRHSRARLAFSSSERDSRFDCRLDKGPWVACDSPERLRVGRGAHSFRVRATDAAGNADATPAVARWRVERRRQR